LDYSRPLLEKGIASARPEGPSARFVQADARRIPLAAGSFHHVMMLGNSFGYAAEEVGDHRILAEAMRVLKPGGWLLADVADGQHIRTRFRANAWHEIGDDVVVCRQRELRDERIVARELVMSKKGGVVRDCTYGIRVYTAEALAAMLERAGFDDVAVHTDFSFFRSDQDVGFMNHRMMATARKP
jgi:D-alanine-D-alanine ligase